MHSRQFLPWNWFKKEDEHAAANKSGRSIAPNTVELNQHPLMRIQQQMDRLFEDLWGHQSMSLRSGLPFDNSTLLRPSLDISESAEGYRIDVEVPGVEQKDLQVELNGDVLTISGEKSQSHEEKSDNYHQVERSYGRFERVLCLPANADREHMDAKFKNGVLTVSFAKKALPEDDSRKRVEISAG
jgi:HSP20 family protein